MQPEPPLASLGLLGSLPPPFDEPLAAHGYPRPQLRRERWASLNGVWDFAIEPSGQATAPEEVTFDARILVPFAPEAPRSGIADTGLYKACWYRTRLTVPELAVGERWMLHFGAVDYQATVFSSTAWPCVRTRVATRHSRST